MSPLPDTRGACGSLGPFHDVARGAGRGSFQSWRQPPPASLPAPTLDGEISSGDSTSPSSGQRSSHPLSPPWWGSSLLGALEHLAGTPTSGAEVYPIFLCPSALPSMLIFWKHPSSSERAGGVGAQM